MNTLNQNDCLLLLIDVQEKLVAMLEKNTVVKQSNILLKTANILGIPTITTNFDAIYERENIEKYGIIINEDLSNLDINKIIEKKDILKNNLKSYKYQNDLHLWNEIFEEIKM